MEEYIYKKSETTPPPIPQEEPVGTPPALPNKEKSRESFEDKRIRLAQEKVDKITSEGIPAYLWNKQVIFLLVCSVVITIICAATNAKLVVAGVVGLVVNAVLMVMITKVKKMNAQANYLQAMQLSRKVGTGVGYSFIVGCAVTAFVTAVLMFSVK